MIEGQTPHHDPQNEVSAPGGEQPTPDTMSRIVPTEPLEHVTERSEFKPWHLPRKQHVRNNQWGAAVDNLINDLADRPRINYLCLPGEDLMDVEVLAELCRRKGRRLQYVGFDVANLGATRSMQRVAAEQILRQTEVVEATSEVIADEFASIARKDSIGARRLRDFGSYDVVNLDMCDAFTSRLNAHNHNAVLELLNYQTHVRGQPWVLFLTTHAETHRLQMMEIAAYDGRMVANMQQSREFRQRIARLLGASQNSTAESLFNDIRSRRPNDSGLSGRWLSLAIGKWLLDILKDGAPWRVDLLSVYCYRTGLLERQADQYAAEPPNLFSLAFRIEKIPQVRTDPSGLACSSSCSGSLDEAYLAQKMAGCVEAHTLDVDLLLQNDEGLRRTLSTECESMLAVRHYSKDAYRQLLNRIPVITYSLSGPSAESGHDG